MTVDADWIAPQWPAPSRVRATCTTRAGGVSTGPYESLNLGDHVGDGAQEVETNRKKFAERIGAHPVFLRQVHGHKTIEIDGSTPDGIEADAAFTRVQGLACTVMVADCLPVLFALRDGSAVAAAHAGWRGLLGGVLESALAALGARDGNEIVTWMGPCIGPRAFEVGADVKRAFEEADASHSRFFAPHAPGKFLADLPGLARARLAAAGVTGIHGNDGSDAWCTVANASRFFSHRRDRVSGRLAAAVWLD